MRRVAITGLGLVTSLGHNLKESWSNLIEGRSGVSLIEQIDTSTLAVKIAGEIKNFQISDDLLDPKEQARFDRFIHLGLQGTKEALEQAELLEGWKDYDPYRVGCILGVGLGGFPYIEDGCRTLIEKGPRRISPFFIPSMIPNMVSGMASIKFNIKGQNFTTSSACASSAHSIAIAATEIAMGRQDVMISGGSESVITPMTISGFSNMKALSRRNEDPSKASRPFDLDRDGFVLGEGAGIVVLEDYESAKKRGATILAEVAGFASTSDAYHITAPHPEGEGAAACMKQCLQNSKVNPEEVGYVNAHGTSTPLGDKGEIKAIKHTFGSASDKLNVSSTKSMLGHLLGAAGGVESVICIQALHKGEIPPTINVENQDPDCDLNVTPNKMVKKDIQYALNNSFGFGGTNCSLLFKKG